MKVKHTQNGNVKITLTQEQATSLMNILNVSSHAPGALPEDEDTSWAIYAGLAAAGIYTAN